MRGRGFRRLSLQSGEKQTAEFTLADDAFAYYCVQRGGWYVEPGEFEIQVGASSRDIRLTAVIEKTSK